MKVLLDSYSTVVQNPSGGMQVRIKQYRETLGKHGVQSELFNKWQHKITDFHVLHVFKLNIESYHLINYAKKNKIPVVISSVVPLDSASKILMNRFICKLLPIHTGYSFMEDALALADAVISETQQEADYIAHNFKTKKSKLYVIPCGVKFLPLRGTNNGISHLIGDDREIVLQVGRFDQNKNQLSVVRALKNTNIPVVFIGGPDPENLAYFNQCKREATPNMYFLGWMKNDDPLLATAYSNAKVVVFPSHNETFGIALVEGCAAGANIVASEGLPIIDWGLSEYCRLINPKSITDMKSKLIEAYNAPRDAAVPSLILNKFSWDSVVEKHMEIYNVVVQRAASQ